MYYKLNLSEEHALQEMDFASMQALRIFRQGRAVIQTSFRDHQAEN